MRDDVRRGKTTATQTLTSSVTVNAGCTYSVSFQALKVQNNGENQPDHTDQWVDLYIGGQRVAGGTTGAGTGDRVALVGKRFIEITGDYTAISGGTVPIDFVFTLQGPTGTNYGNDDIGVANVRMRS